MNHLHRSFGKLILAKNIDIFKTTGYIFKTRDAITNIFSECIWLIKTEQNHWVMA